MVNAAAVETSTTNGPLRESRGRPAKRALILDAAIRVFARTGYHGARVSDIASEAGIAYGLVYHYFRNKEEILSTIFEERWSGFVESVQEIAEREEPSADKLLAIASLILGGYRVRPDWVKVFVLEIQRSSRFADPGQIRAVGRLLQAVAGVVRQGQASGELRGDLDPDVACLVFMGGLELALTSLVLGVVRADEGEGGADAYYPKLAQTVVEVFLRGIAGEPTR